MHSTSLLILNSDSRLRSTSDCTMRYRCRDSRIRAAFLRVGGRAVCRSAATVGTGSYAVDAFVVARKVTYVSVTDQLPDSRYRVIGAVQQRLGAGQADPHEVLVKRNSHVVFEKVPQSRRRQGYASGRDLD